MNQQEYTLGCAVWEFTLACNLRCEHCGSSAGKARKAELSHEEAMRLCDGLKEAGCLGVALMGGEPFMRADWHEVASRIRSNGMELSIITNGTTAPKDAIAKLKALSPRAVAVSIDAADPALHDQIRGAKGAFDKAWAFIDKASAAGLPVSVITTIHKKNIGQLAALRDMLLNRGIAWQVQTAGAEGDRFARTNLLNEEEFYSVGVFLGTLKKMYTPKQLPAIGAHDLGYNSYIIPNLMLCEEWQGCQAGISVLGIQSDGGVKGCLSMNSLAVEASVRERSVAEIWNDPKCFAYNRDFDPLELGKNCSRCEFRLSCKGGCNEMSHMLTGHYHNDPMCFYKIEQKIFKEELANPFKRFFMEARRSMNRTIRSKRDLWGFFKGKR